MTAFYDLFLIYLMYSTPDGVSWRPSAASYLDGLPNKCLKFSFDKNPILEIEYL